MRIKMRKILTIGMAVTMGLALMGCSDAGGELKEIKMTYVTAPLNIPSIVEKDRTILEEELKEQKTKVTYANLTTGPEQTQALASGDVHILNAVGAASVILPAANGADIKIINMYSRSPEAFRIFTKDASIQSPQDLKGKKIAGPKGTTLYELLLNYLEQAGMSESDVEFVNLDIPKTQAALEGGTVDAALLAGPAAYNTEQAGYPVLTTGEGLVDGICVTATSGEFAKEHPEVIEKFKSAQKKTLEFMNTSFEDTVKITAKETGLSEAAVKEMYPLYNFSAEITEADIASLKKTKEFMLQNKMIEKDMDIEGLILK